MLGDSASELDGIIKGELRIAVITTAKYFMPHLLGPFINQHSQVKPRLTVTNRDEVLARLKSNEDDLLVMGQVPQEFEVQAYPFINNELVVVASPNHPLADDRSITLEQLSQERFLVREQGSGTRQAVDRLFENRVFKLHPIWNWAVVKPLNRG